MIEISKYKLGILRNQEGSKNMVEDKDVEKVEKGVFKTWIESYATISKMWNDYYTQIYKPWFESTGELFEKAIQLSKNPSPEKYKEFYGEWIKAYSENLNKFQISSIKSNKDILEKILSGADESTQLYRSWIIDLEDNSRKTRDLLKEEAEKLDISKYKEIYDMWITSYGKAFEGFLALPLKNLKDIFESRSGVPDVYTDSYIQISKQWQDTYKKFYEPWMESIIRLSDKSAEIAKGQADVDKYKEFYNLWLDIYKQHYGKIFDVSTAETKQVVENFTLSNNVYINLYKSWVIAIEKLSQKIKEVSNENVNTGIGSEYLKLWIKTYEKFFDSFFENTPTVGPFREMLEPIKTATKIYLDTFSRMVDIWIKFYSMPYSR